MELGVPGEQVHVVYQGVDDVKFCQGNQAEARQKLKITRDMPVLLFVGNLLKVKGLEVLLNACSKLKEVGTGFQLYLAGAGPERARREGLAQRSELTGDV